MQANQGTGGWAFKHLRAQVITGFLADLHSLEENGLDDARCKQVREALQAAVHQIQAAHTTAKDSVNKDVLRHVLDHLTEVSDSYFLWNNGKTPRERRLRLADLKAARKRFKLACKIVERTHRDDCDRKPFDTIHDGFHKLCGNHPDHFRNWKASLRRYEKRAV